MSAKNTPDKFWSRVAISAPNKCWEWQGAITSGGYGNLSWNGISVQAHRLAYYLAKGKIKLGTGFRIPGRAHAYKRFVLHTCDNRRCCNPQHLFLGSLRANMLDAYKKARKVQPKSGHANAKLSAIQVQQIRRRYDASEAVQVELAAEFGVSQRVISLIVRRESYKDVSEWI
jgi:hypothetical protein